MQKKQKLLILLGALFAGTSFLQSQSSSPARSISQFQSAFKGVLSPQKNKEASILMSDPAMSQAWAHRKIAIQKALRLSQGNDVVIAVIDTGIDTHHPDLANNLWVNPGETGKDSKGRDKASNGIDDDKNGCTDDVYGCNFITGSGTVKALKDNHGHGTHISGIISAEGGNGVGIVGVAPKSKVMTLKYYDPQAKNANNLMNTVKAIRYAVNMKRMYPQKIKKMIINYSGGGMEFSQTEKDAIAEARKEDILFVAAAGNEKSFTDDRSFGYYPAGYELDNIISVMGTTPKEERVKSSNFGKKTVDIAAPGVNVYSTYPGGRYGEMTGTSQATAFATGVAAMIMDRYPDFSAQQVKKYILKTGDYIPKLRELNGTSRRLNSYKALVTLDSDVSAMGTLATNTQHMNPLQFTAEGNGVFAAQGNSSFGSLSNFSKNLKNALEEKSQNKRLRLPNNQK